VRQIWRAQSFDFPEGAKVAHSGRLYLSLGGVGQVLVLSPDGNELERLPRTQSDNSRLPIPLNDPATLVFAGEDALIANHAFLGYNPQAWAIIDFHAGEPGAPLFYPVIRPFATRPAMGPATPAEPSTPGARIRLKVRPQRVRVGRRTRLRFTATFAGGGHDRPLRAAMISFHRRTRYTDARGHATIIVRLKKPGLQRASARAPGLLDGAATVRGTRPRHRRQTVPRVLDRK
jgi:hypothetical protein